MKINHGILCIVLVLSQFLYARLNVLDVDPRCVELISTHEKQFCYISFVRINGEIYLVKQKKRDCIDKIIGVVHECVTAWIAEILDGRMAHRVDVIPAGKDFPGKMYADWPATIHTIAPGKTIQEQRGRYRKMNIKQGVIGFRRDMLAWMGRHKTLIKIVALDTFVCNHDRHRGNLFYDARKNSFCAIDMDLSYRFNLCEMAYKGCVDMLKPRKLKVRGKELYALIEYRKYLQFLIKTFRPEDIIEMYDYFAARAGFVEGAPLYTSSVSGDLRRYKMMIVKSYEDAHKLVLMVGNVINKAQNKVGRW